MTRWLIGHRLGWVRWSRWIVIGCAVALLGIASLPPGQADRIIALVGIAGVGLVFAAWLVAVLLTLFQPARRRSGR